jgi:hypothetical protein
LRPWTGWPWSSTRPGRFDIFVEAMLESNKALYDFLGEDVAAIDGILTTETFHLLAVDKFNHMWALPDAEQEDLPADVRGPGGR